MITLPVATVFTPVPALSEDLRVHSVFASGFNLTNGSRTLVWVAPLADAAYPASIGIGIGRERWLDLGIQAELTPGDPVRVDDGSDRARTADAGVSLIIEEGTTVESTEIPTGKVVSRPDYSTVITEAIQADRRAQPAAYDLVVAATNEHLGRALVALRDADAAVADLHLRQIIGLGFGLTPTADDAVIGALGYTRMFDADLFRRLSAAVTPLLDRTTAVSATYLALATQGHFSRPVAQTLEGYVSEPAPGSLSGLLSMGYSSGRDTARGIVVAASVPISSPQPTAT